MLSYGNILRILRIKLNDYLITMPSKYIWTVELKEKHMKCDDILEYW